MAKSIRSKWKRKCRAIKRIRYGQKELERLKKTLGIDESNSPSSSGSNDAHMAELHEIATVKTVEDIKDSQNDENTMHLDVKSVKRFDARTLRDKNGAYPVWLHPRKVKGGSKKNKKKKQKNKKN